MLEVDQVKNPESVASVGPPRVEIIVEGDIAETHLRISGAVILGYFSNIQANTPHTCGPDILVPASLPKVLYPSVMPNAVALGSVIVPDI